MAAPPGATTAAAPADIGIERHESAAKYPRPVALRVVRMVLRRWWVTIVFVVGSAAQTVGQSLLQNGWDGIQLDGIRNTAIGHFAAQHGAVFWCIATVLIAFIPIGLLAQRDYKHEQAALAEQWDAERISSLISSTLQHSQVEQSTIPFDLYKLRAPQQFVDRIAARSWLIERLRTTQGGATYAVEGLGGIGKTSLVAETLHAAKREGIFPDGIAVVLCNDQLEPTTILRNVLRSFSLRQGLYTADHDALADLAGHILRGKRALIVLDNVEPGLDLGQVTAPLEDAGAVVVVTARFRVPIQLRRDAIQLDVLDEADACTVFEAYYGRPRSPQDEATMKRLVHESGCHTLAVVLAASYAAESGRSLESLANDLSDADAVLDLASDDAHGRVRTVFQKSYQQLPQEAQRTFQALSVMPTGDYTRAAALAVSKSTGVAQPGAQIDLLVRRALLDQYVAPEFGDERLRQHPLLRVFAADVAGEEVRETAGRGMAEHYLDFTTAHADNYPRLDDEYGNIVGGLTWAQRWRERSVPGSPANAQYTRMVASYVSTLRPFLFFRGHQRDGARFVSWGIDAAQVSDQPELLATLLVSQGKLQRGRADYAEAERSYDQALALARQLGARQVEAMALEALGDLAHARHDWDTSIAIREQARQVYHELGDQKNEAQVICAIGHVLSNVNRFAEAKTMLGEGLSLAQASSAKYTVAFATHMLGQIYRREGKLTEAQVTLKSALEQYTALGELGSIGGALEDLGRVEEALGHTNQALADWNQAVEIYTAMGIARADYVQQYLISRPVHERPDF